MRALLSEYEAILDLAGRAESFASLSWTTQTDDPARGALLQKVTVAVSGIPSKVTSRAWVVTGIADNLQPTSMTRTLSLTEIPPTF